ERERRGRRQRGRTGRNLHDGGPDADARGPSRHPGDGRHRIRSVRLGGPHRVKAEAVRLLDEREVDAEGRTRVTDVHAEPHGYPPSLSLRVEPRPPDRAGGRAAGPATGTGPGGSALSGPAPPPAPAGVAGSACSPRWRGG